MKQFENHENYNCRITLQSGDSYHVFADWLKQNQLHHWQGWHCEAGVAHIYIDKNLGVWSGQCQNDYLGDVHQGWNTFEHHSICRRDTCSGCADDLLTAKWQP